LCTSNGEGVVELGRKIDIKKYPNRRLYNTQTSNYITIKDVAEQMARI